MPKASSQGAITAYIEAALSAVRLERLNDGSYYAEIPDCPGVWANEKTEEECLQVLREVLEEWIVLKLKDNDPLPEIQGQELGKVVTEK